MSAPLDPDLLLAHGEWIRRLARRLVGDEATAADLVQETWVAALRHPPADAAALRPWLARTLRRFAWRRRRSESARAERERLVARPEPAPPESEALERLETQRVLVETLLALEEPLRTTLVERYLEERTAADVARRHGVPAGTVRWRAKRGLERLRELLDERHGGDRARWLSALAPLAGRPGGGAPASEPPPPGAPGALLTGALTMKAALEITAVALVLVAGTLAWRGLTGESPVAADVASPSSRAASAPARELARADAEPDRGPATPRAAPRTVREAEATTEQREAAAPASDAARVLARLLDDWGRPIAGAALAVEGEDGPSARSGDDGRVTLEVPLPARSFPVRLTAAGAGLATRFFRARLERGEPTWLGDVVLRPGGRVTGTVVDAERRPVAGATVELADAELPPGEPEFLRLEGPFLGRRGLAATTDADGGFAIDGASVGAVRAWAVAEGMRWTFGEPVEIAIDRPLSLVLVLEPLAEAERIEGTVVTPADDPLPDAVIVIEFASKGTSGDRYVFTGEDGTFSAVRKRRGEHWLTASDPRQRYARSERVAAPPGSGRLVLRLREQLEVPLRVRSTTGTPVPRYTARVLYEAGGAETDFAVREDSGETTLRVAREPFRLEIEAAGFEGRALGPFGAGTDEKVEVELEPLAGLSGRVRSAAGPVPGARVGLFEPYADDVLVIRDGLRSWLPTEPLAEAVADGEGAFQLPLPDAGAFVVRASAEGFADAEVDVDAALPPASLVVGMDAGGVIEGRVLVPRGVDPAGRIVLAHRGVGRPAMRRVGPDGAFRFERCTPGRWDVRLVDTEPDPSTTSTHMTTGVDPEPFPWNCEVFEGRTTAIDLDATAVEDCVVRGRLVAEQGLAETWTATLWPTMTLGLFAREELPSATLAPDGTFTLASPRRGFARLVLRSSSGAVVSQGIELVEGELEWSHPWRCGSLEGSAASVPEGVETPFYFVLQEGEVASWVPLPPDAWGSFHRDEVPAGRGRVVRWEPGHEAASPWRWETAAEVAVEVGRTARVELP